MLFSFLSFATIGGGLVVSVWLASEIGSIQLVGQLFFLSSLTSLLFSVYAGSIIDCNSRIQVVRWGQAIRLSGVSILAIGTLTSNWLVASLYIYTILVSIGTSLNAGALDGIFQAAVPKNYRINVSIKASIVRQLGLVVGTGAGGVLLHTCSSFVSVATMTCLVLIQVVIIELFFISFAHSPMLIKNNIFVFWVEGFKSVSKNSSLVISIVAVALLFSVSQMSNVLVPNFVSNTLHKGSDVYGLFEIAWSAGGGSMLLIAALRGKSLSSGGKEFIMLSLIGGLMIIFAISRMVPFLVLIYALLGALFSLARAICDGQILVLARSEEIGRVRSATSMLISFLGMIIYLSPSIIAGNDVVKYYYFWGAVIIVFGFSMYFINRNISVVKDRA